LRGVVDEFRQDLVIISLGMETRVAVASQAGATKYVPARQADVEHSGENLARAGEVGNAPGWRYPGASNDEGYMNQLSVQSPTVIVQAMLPKCISVVCGHDDVRVCPIGRA